MPRLANPDSDFKLSVDGIGTFTFGYRTLADEFAIQRKIADLTNGGPTTKWLNLMSNWIATLGVLTVKAPEGWDLETMDPLDPVIYKNLSRVYDALSEKEYSFRGRTRPESEAAGETTGADD